MDDDEEEEEEEGGIRGLKIDRNWKLHKQAEMYNLGRFHVMDSGASDGEMSTNSIPVIATRCKCSLHII